MVSTKAYFDRVIANQQQLLESYSHYTDKTVEAVAPDRALTARGMELFMEMMGRPFEMMDGWSKKEQLELLQNDFWAVYSDRLNKTSEVSAEMLSRSIEFMNLMTAQYSLPAQQERIRRMGEAFQTWMAHYRQAMEASAEATREFMGLDK